jgi:hypothetical protein
MKQLVWLVLVSLILFLGIFSVCILNWHRIVNLFSSMVISEGNLCKEISEGVVSYYVDPQGLCAPCSDANSGEIDHPWCTIARAFQRDKPTYLHGGQALYLRGGIHRYNMLDFSFNFTIQQNQLTGAANNPTIISGFPGEDARIYGSERVSGWQKMSDNGQVIWYFDWYKYLQQNKPWFANNGLAPVYLDSSSFNSIRNYTHCPGAIYIDDNSPLVSSPIILQQANKSKILPPSLARYLDASSLSVQDYEKYYFSGYSTMPAGYVFYENDPKQSDFGRLYIKLPDSLKDQDPNNLSIEIPLQLGFYFGWFGNFHSFVHLANFSFRYTNGLGYPFSGGLGLTGNNNILSNLDISYNPFVGLFGSGSNNLVAHSAFRYNDAFGAQFVGDNFIYESNIFEHNSEGHFSPAWSAGGAKLIPRGFNITFRNNLFYNNKNIGLWFDYTGDGQSLRNGTKDWDSYTGAGLVIENNTFINGGLVIETSPGSEKNPNIVKNNIFFKESFSTKSYNISNYFFDTGAHSQGILILGVPYTYIYNNLFYNVSYGIIAYLPEVYTGEDIKKGELSEIYWAEANIRRRQDHLNISSNIFNFVGLPIILTNDSFYNPNPSLVTNYYPKSIDSLFIDNNLYFGSSLDTLPGLIKSTIDFSDDFQDQNISEGYPCCFFGTYYQERCGCPSYKVNNRTNQDSNVKLTANTYLFYKSHTQEDLKNTPFFKVGQFLFHPEWDVFSFLTLDQWKENTGFDNHSIYSDPGIDFSSGSLIYSNSSIFSSIQFDPHVGSLLSVRDVVQLICTEKDWISNFSSLTCSENGTREKTWVKIRQCSNGTSHPAIEEVSCEYNPLYNNTLNKEKLNLTYTSKGWILEDKESGNKLILFDKYVNESILEKIKIKRGDQNESRGYLIINNLTLREGETKTLYLEKKNSSSNALCIKDSEGLNNIQDIQNECLKIRCPSTNGVYSCEVENNTFIIKGLNHSGIIEDYISCDDRRCDNSSEEDGISCSVGCGKYQTNQDSSQMSSHGNSGGGAGGGSDSQNEQHDSSSEKNIQSNRGVTSADEKEPSQMSYSEEQKINKGTNTKSKALQKDDRTDGNNLWFILEVGILIFILIITIFIIRLKKKLWRVLKNKKKFCKLFNYFFSAIL